MPDRHGVCFIRPFLRQCFCACQFPQYEEPVESEFPQVLAEAVGLKTQRLSGTTDELAGPIGKNRRTMKKLILIPRSLGMPRLLSARCLLRTGATVIVWFLFSQAVFAADFTVTSPGFFYAINGNQPNPTITLAGPILLPLTRVRFIHF